jgi:hypothetical protein
MKRLLALAAMTNCLLLAGCSGLTLGPQTKSVYILVGVGQPVQVLSNVTVQARALTAPADSAPVAQNIGGWISMPSEHWAAIKRALEAAEKGK